MKIAIPTRDHLVDDHFGHCAYYTVFTLDDEKNICTEERLESPGGCGCNKLSAHGISVVRGCAGDIDAVLRDYIDGKLSDSAEVCDHHDCHERGKSEDFAFQIGKTGSFR